MTKFLWGLLLGIIVGVAVWLVFFERSFCTNQVKGKVGGFLSGLGLGSTTVDKIDSVLFQ